MPCFITEDGRGVGGAGRAVPRGSLDARPGMPGPRRAKCFGGGRLHVVAIERSSDQLIIHDTRYTHFLLLSM